MRLAFILLVAGVALLKAQDFSYRVREVVLDQRDPVPVNVSTKSTTTLQFPAPIQSLEGDGFTTKPNDERGDFYISPGVNWVSLRSLQPAAVQNLGVIIDGRIYEVVIQTAIDNDYAVIFRWPHTVRHVWSPPLLK
jgi:hypothetical protein